MRIHFIVCSAAVATVLLAGCASSSDKKPSGHFTDFSRPVTNATTVDASEKLDPALLRPPTALFTLGPGDRVELEVIGNATSRTVTAVGPDGKIYFHLLPGLDVWGLTLSQAQELIQKELGKYLNNPQVALTLREVSSKHVWIVGRLAKPGIYPMASPMTLVEGISLAGGAARSSSQITTEDLGDLRHSFVMRKGEMLPVDFRRLFREGDTSQNIYLEPDDFVFVPSALAQEVYVLGAVRFPRAVPYNENMTLVGALAGSYGAVTIEWLSPTQYGTLPDAYLSHVAVVRGSLTQPQVAIVDYGAIVKGKAPDVRLEPGDIVYVPNTPYGTLKRYVNLIVNTFITTVAANEGVRAGGGEVSVGVTVPVGP